jgi:preprotein translocase subunit SecG
MNGLFGGNNGILGGISPMFLLIIFVLLTSGCGGIGDLFGGGNNSMFIILILFFCLSNSNGCGCNSCDNN